MEVEDSQLLNYFSVSSENLFGFLSIHSSLSEIMRNHIDAKHLFLFELLGLEHGKGNLPTLKTNGIFQLLEQIFV